MKISKYTKNLLDAKKTKKARILLIKEYTSTIVQKTKNFAMKKADLTAKLGRCAMAFSSESEKLAYQESLFFLKHQNLPENV